MRQTVFATALAALLAASQVSPAFAANKEHQQLMADIRILQEQSQQLQNLLNALNESLKAVNTRLDQQTEATRRAFADQKLVVDNLSNDVRVIREKLEDNNVRVGSLTQEVEALRQGLQQQAARPTMTTTTDADAQAANTTAPPNAIPSIGQSPQKMYDSAQADYMAGQYDLAVIGFQEFIKAFPRSEQADDAQVSICAAYLNNNKPQEAADACDLAIRTYPASEKLPEAYYRKGLALSNLRDYAGARAAWEFILQNYKTSEYFAMAQQGLQRTPPTKRPG
ncbi:MAG TPA: outer membrane protein assembly factor BamD [Vicinamibacterales bacterium]|jgi:TolA-binding protein